MGSSLRYNFGVQLIGYCERIILRQPGHLLLLSHKLTENGPLTLWLWPQSIRIVLKQ